MKVLVLTRFPIFDQSLFFLRFISIYTVYTSMEHNIVAMVTFRTVIYLGMAWVDQSKLKEALVL